MFPGRFRAGHLQEGPAFPPGSHRGAFKGTALGGEAMSTRGQMLKALLGFAFLPPSGPRVPRRDTSTQYRGRGALNVCCGRP